MVARQKIARWIFEDRHRPWRDDGATSRWRHRRWTAV